MAELLKDVYSKAFITSVARHFKQVYPHFDQNAFITTIFDDNWQQRALKSRLTFIAHSLHTFLPANFPQSCAILKQVAPHFSGYEAMFFPAYIELYGLNDYHTSIDALASLTQHSTAEFAVRPFIIHYPEQMMTQMLLWAKSENVHIRRLASEGCRPRLPWACALPLFKQDPRAILTILECLKDDQEDYVYRSVANNLNDISKDHPQLVIQIAKAWLQGDVSQNRRWLVKHACRGLLKSGHSEVLALFGFTAPKHLSVNQLVVDKTVVMGESLNFSFSVDADKVIGKVRIEFILSFMKKNGKQADKIFKISEPTILSLSKAITKQFSFKAVSTRKYYPGLHQLTIVINGVKFSSQSFTLLTPLADY